MRPGKALDLLVGVLALAVLAGLLTVAYLAYDRALVPHRDVTLRTDVVGNALKVGSDVKFQGVPVGQVTEISATDAGADLELALDPETLDLVPDNVVARLLPKTMFGERYVALVVPADPSSTTLQAGDVIRQDASAEAAELQQVLDELLPVLRAVQPEKLSAMLGEFADMLDGQGERLGDAMVAWSRYVRKLEPHVPQMADDLASLARVADQWQVAAPDLVDALATMTTTASTLVDKQTELREVYASVISSSDTTRGWVADNHDTIVVLSEESKAALRATSPYASQFPCLFRAVAGMKDKMETTLGVGTDEPGMHAVLTVMPARSKYLAKDDQVRFTKGTPAPRCPYVTGKVGTKPPRASDRSADLVWPQTERTTRTADTDDPEPIGPPPGNVAHSYLTALSGLGDANSPGENQLIAELVAPTQGLAPDDYPRWNSLLLGPGLRNTKVVLQ
ncbi:MCE family protein [Nocardioides lianchengensis]|uniref:Phospholipid/cholesterol/gamma-HCH transport system substrate-binding protein n=1 Tax=Nocardioides lianchengensis TaxID=1045774 RepID=A0A1G7B639_9ACTN|nr:MCE family protein [Nocardioides lianchengensis]NYG10103.1 phospholipid/cholesterol/gamma-HCH transport system substrate-binding protein [Nocardioides lianchengensis]SDE22501.1 phospholipid/cholesterol/gamma-HCH transport system substrate-binding protein [Nocardioides lianchengensis]